MTPTEKEFEAYYRRFAKNCPRCKGQRTILVNGVLTRCICQNKAVKRLYFDKISISPSSLKYKEWDDFNGSILNLEGDVDGALTVSSLEEAKRKAMEYCFDHWDIDVDKERNKAINIDRHLRDGQNLVIFGSPGSGKTLLAVLVLKELLRCMWIRKRDYRYKWIKFTDLVGHARWDNSRSVNHDRLDELSESHFLFIDGIDVYRSGEGHNTPPDLIELDRLFSYRRAMSIPTIMTATTSLRDAMKAPALAGLAKKWCGDELISMMCSSETVRIVLDRGDIVGKLQD